MIENTIQIDTSAFSTLFSASRMTARNTTLSTYDYTTIIIAAVALVVSLASLYIAKCTLDSQKKTEQNTRTISLSTLLSMLNKLLVLSYVNFVRASVMKAKWSTKAYAGFPHNDIIGYMRFPLDYIQVDRCNDLTEKQYVCLLELTRVLRDYNDRLDRRFANFIDSDVPVKIKERDLNRIEFEACWTMKRIIESINTVKGSDSIGECIKAISETSKSFMDDASSDKPGEKLSAPECTSMLKQLFAAGYDDFVSQMENNLSVLNGCDKRGEEYVCIIESEN